MMHFGVRQVVASVFAAALILFCSCEKHRLGEDPEIQKENVKGAEQNLAAPNKSDNPEATTSGSTPAEFFPKASPTP